MPKKPAADDVLRPAGLIERWHVSREYLGYDACVIVSAKYTSNNTPLTRERLVLALSYMLKRTCALAVQVRGETENKPVLIRLKSVDLSRILMVPADDGRPLTELLETCHSEPFVYETEDPIWRVALLPDGTVVFQFDHTIADGQSGVAFHVLLQEALEQTVGQPPLTSDVVSIPSDIDVPLPMEKVLNLSPSAKTVLRELFNVFAPARMTKFYSAWAGNPVLDKKHAKSYTRQWLIPAQMATAVTNICRAHQSTITSFFYTISMAVLTDLILSSTAIPPKKKRKIKSISTVTPLSFRKHLKLGPGVLCNYVSIHGDFARLPKSPRPQSTTNEQKEVSWEPYFSWDNSAKFAKTLRDNLLKSCETAGLMKYLFGNYQGYVKSRINRKRDVGYELSNVGRWPVDAAASPPPSADQAGVSAGVGDGNAEKHTETWTVDEVFFSQCDSTIGAAIKMSVAGSPSGAVGVTVNWGEGSIEDEFAEEFVKAFRAAVEHVVANEGAKGEGKV